MNTFLTRGLGASTVVGAFALVSACSSSSSSGPATTPGDDAGSGGCTAATHCTLIAAGTSEDDIQGAIASAKSGDTIQFAAGTFSFTNEMTIAANDFALLGAGIDQTIFDFSKQASGSEGIFGQNLKNLRLEGFTVEDTKGNAIKVLGTTGVTFRSIKTLWNSTDLTTHGAYGLYPVQSTNVLIEKCLATGASDTGLYIGQSQQIVVRNNEAHDNVAGIEIENSYYADVYGNDSHDNTGGILVFGLPELQQEGGHDIRVHDNQIHDNNLKNFAPAGNIVGKVPAGTGFFVMANDHVELFGNTFTNNGTAQSAVVSYYVTSSPINDAKYYAYPSNIYFHDNTYVNGGTSPDSSNDLGILLLTGKSAFPNGVISDVLYDGILDPAKTTPPENPMTICVKQPTSQVANLHLDKLGTGGASTLADTMVIDSAPYDCTLPAIAAVSFPGLN